MEDAIHQFMGITGADDQTARFYLEMTGGDVEAAMSQYFDSGARPVSAAQATPLTTPTPAPIMMPAAQPSQPRPTATSSAKSSAPAKSKSVNRGAIKTVSDLRGDEGDDSDEDRQAYFTGGEKSGLQQLGPSKKDKTRAQELTEEVFAKAKERGAQSIDEFNREQKSQKFTGAGYRLGHTASTPGAKTTPVPETQKKERTVTLTFYSDGFTVDDGPLRSFEDPANAEFLDAINRGYVPREITTNPEEEVTVNLVDKKGEKYTPPPKKFTAFEGKGKTLGSAASSSSASAAPPTASAPKPAQVQLAENEPTTTIQIRLHDGTRLVARFNPDRHTVGDIRKFVAQSLPIPRGTSFSLMTTFPNKELTDDSATIAAAKLQNAVIVQKLK